MATNPVDSRKYIITLSCRDNIGIVAEIAGLIAKHGGSIVEAHQHSDIISNDFFMRIEMEAASLSDGIEKFIEELSSLSLLRNIKWKLNDTKYKKRVIILCSRQEHCLYDLLARWYSQDFKFDIPCVISNHLDLKTLVEAHNIPFHYLPVTPNNQLSISSDLMALFEYYNADVVVLARYMQILGSELCQQYAGKIINIHHSVLPSFVGAKPYHQAFERGVKVIGATCHYVTEELDAGPIIEQDVVHVYHGDTVRELIRHGKDIEKVVLSRGLRYHIEDRVMMHNKKTIVFK